MTEFYDKLEEDFRNSFEPPSPPDEKIQPWTDTKIVGKPLQRVDAYERVSGKAEYTYDVILPDMVYGAILRCPHAHAIVKNIDTSAAEKMPGVVGLITGKSNGADIPWYSVGYGGGPMQSKLFDPHCRYQGEEVAAVAAMTPYQAYDALKAIKPEYEVLPFVIEPDEALKPDAPKIFEAGNSTGKPMPSQRGSVEKGFAEADVVLEETFTTSVQMHAALEAHGSVVKWDGDKITIWDSTQGVYDACMLSFARTMKMPNNNVRVICRYVGGAFGAKLELGKYTVMAALLARKSGRPVKLMLPREDTMLAVGNRPITRMTVKAGVKKDGTLTALQLTSVYSPGAYSSGAMTGFLFQELYKCPNVMVTESGVYTNVGRARAFRAPGFPTAAWALEQMMDMLAGKINMDPVELRLKNFTEVSQSRGMPYTSAGLKDCLTEGAKRFGWKKSQAAKKEAGHIKRGVGMAAGLWMMGSGGPPYTAEVRMFADGGVTLKTGAMDLGTGTKTVACMVAAEELGVPLENIRILNADTAITPYASSSGGSMTLASLVPAVRRGAWIVRRQIMDWAAEALGVSADDLEIRKDTVVSRSNPDKKRTLEQLFRAKGVMDVIAIGNREPNPANKVVMPFSAQFAEVEVNTKTGAVKVLRLLSADDSGRVGNLKTYENQVYGGMLQCLGYGLFEKRVMDRKTGKMCNPNLNDYKVPGALDIPVNLDVAPVDLKDSECNNVGCKGIGEPCHVPTAAAIANAIHDAIGVRLTNSPMDNRIILELLSKQKRG
ncbi:MAG TPA: xanthine dehydrogenase family protein molybdopterin-binding subunit [Acidobacteriota bacterium]|nr:xanthine dehydrogenase family protein molybdopterin-binding subunit [Acidobacteriota bacterium]